MPDDQDLLNIHQREGSIFISGAGQEHLVLGCVVVAAIPDPTGQPGMIHYRWAVNGDLVQAATVLARFLVGNPPFAAVVDGLRDIFAHGNRISGSAPPDVAPPPPPGPQP